MEAEIRLVYKNSREAEAVAKAVSPDNVKVPSGLMVETIQKGDKVTTRIVYEGKLQTFMSTIDDLLESVSIAENTFIVAKRHAKSQS